MTPEAQAVLSLAIQASDLDQAWWTARMEADALITDFRKKLEADAVKLELQARVYRNSIALGDAVKAYRASLASAAVDACSR
jgi:hypothetical protein